VNFGNNNLPLSDLKETKSLFLLYIQNSLILSLVKAKRIVETNIGGDAGG
jgi:hypothetical protein